MREVKVQEEQKAQRTSLPGSQDSSYKGSNSQVRRRDLLPKRERSLVLGEQALDLFDSGEKTDRRLVLGVEEVGEEGS
jgi:hypothetical protein